MIIKHLSDLHINPIYHKRNIDKTKFILSEIVESNFDHLIVSGDIAHDADKDSFLIFKDFLKEFNLLDSKKTTITIGNHDIYGGVYSVKDLINFPERCRKTNYENKVFEFVNHYEELFIDCIFTSEGSIFPYAKIIGNYAFIVINTNDYYSAIKNPFASNGKVTKTEFMKLIKLFNHDKIINKQKIILSHHHFNKNNYETKSSSSEIWNKIEGYTLKLRGKKRLLQLFKKNNVITVLHGHNHENKKYERKGICFFNAGGTVDNDHETLVGCNSITFNQNSLKQEFDYYHLSLKKKYNCFINFRINKIAY